jgi:putative ABC transport system permease protein
VRPIQVPGETYAPGQAPIVSFRIVTPGFFAAMSIPIRAGRDVSDADTAQSQPVAVVSESFVRRHWPHDNPIGRQFIVVGQARTVVGVVGDVRVRGLERSSEPQLYVPYRQHPESVGPYYAPKDLVVKVAGDPSSIVPAVRRAIAAADPHQPVSDLRPLEDIVAGETAPRSVQLRVLGGFAGLACLLAAFGIHGLVSFTVSTQTRDIGVRLALGAQRGRVVAGIVQRAWWLALAGLATGVALAIWAGRTLEVMLAGLSASDPLTFSLSAAIVFAMTTAGSLAASWRAVQIDPIEAIRGVRS